MIAMASRLFAKLITSASPLCKSLFNEWGAARIPVELVNNIILVVRGGELAKVLTEIQALTRRVRLRKYARIQMA